MKNLTQLPILLSFSLIAACGGDSGDSIGVQVHAVTNSGETAPSSLVTVDDSDTEYLLTSAVVNLRHIELDLPEGLGCEDVADELESATCDSDPDDDSDKIVITGPFSVDLITGVSTPSLEDVKIPAGTYTRIDFRVEDNQEDVSLAVTADFEHGGETMSLDLSLDFNEDIRIEEENGTTIDSDSDLIAEFVVSDWLAGVDISSCIDDEDVTIEGSVVIVNDSSTSGSCSDIEDTIKNNMKNSGQFDRD